MRIELNAEEAFRFMRECAPLLEEGGFGRLSVSGTKSVASKP